MEGGSDDLEESEKGLKEGDWLEGTKGGLEDRPGKDCRNDQRKVWR